MYGYMPEYTVLLHLSSSSSIYCEMVALNFAKNRAPTDVNNACSPYSSFCTMQYVLDLRITVGVFLT